MVNPKGRLTRREWAFDPFSMQFMEELTTEDEYFESHEPSDEGRLHDLLLSQLREDERACVELTVFGGLSYRGAAQELGWFTTNGPDGKKVWRYATRGLRKLKDMLEAVDAEVRVPMPGGPPDGADEAGGLAG